MTWLDLVNYSKNFTLFHTDVEFTCRLVSHRKQQLEPAIVLPSSQSHGKEG